MNISISTILQPFIRKTFDYFFGEFIDSKKIDLNQLSLNGITNLELDT